MKKIYILLFAIGLLFQSNNSLATIWTITTPGFSFSPATITITLGDTVMFNIDSFHDALEVSQATWNINGSTSNGGFAIPFGGGMLIPSQVKTYYYVCEPHAGSGMKGQIIVNTNTGLPIVEAYDKVLSLSPNPASNITYVHTGIANGIANRLTVFDLVGKTVLTLENISNNHALDVSALRKGIYFVEIKAEDYKRTGKLVVGQ